MSGFRNQFGLRYELAISLMGNALSGNALLGNALLVTALLGMLVGCGEASSNVAIQGKVSVAGEPLPGGTLTFFPNEGRPLATVLSKTGTYSCEVPPGDYRVTLVVGVQLPPGWEEGDRIPEPAFQIPMQFTTRKRTPLRATVTPGQSEPIDFSLGE